MSRSTIVLIVILVFACLWFGAIFRACTPGASAWGPGYGGAPIFVGGGGGWNRGGWSSGGSSSSSSPSTSGRSAGGLRGGGIIGGRGGK